MVLVSLAPQHPQKGAMGYRTLVRYQPKCATSHMLKAMQHLFWWKSQPIWKQKKQIWMMKAAKQNFVGSQNPTFLMNFSRV
jgi:hypothetical protein